MDRTAWKERTEIFVPWIQVIGLLIAGGYAVYEYTNHVKEVKVQRAADYLARLNSGELLDANTKLSVQLQKEFDRFQATHPDNMPDKAYSAAYYKFIMVDVLMHGQEKSLSPSLNAVTAFLDDGVVCSQTGLCDEETIRSNLSEFGKDTVETYYPYFCYLRALWKDDTLGERVVKFYASSSSDKACKDYEDALKNIGVKSHRLLRK
jgi:hypothetical protein